MPNTANEFSTFYRGVLVINATSARQGRTEKFLMAGDNWDDCALQLKVLAACRATLLGRDAQLSYASLAQWGPSRAAQVVISDPLPGGMGVKWDALAVARDVVSNNPSCSLRFRQETNARDFIMRQLICVPDSIVAGNKYIGGTGEDDVVDLGAYTTPITADAVTLPQQSLWTLGTDPTGVTTHLLWRDALKMYLNVLHNLTYWGKTTSPTVAIGRTWKRVVYRGVGRVHMGRPILR